MKLLSSEARNTAADASSSAIPRRATGIMTEMRKQNDANDYTRYLSTILSGLSIQAANGSTKAELKRTAEMTRRHLGY